MEQQHSPGILSKAYLIFSYLFHPLLMPTIGLVLIFHTQSYINFLIPPPLRLVIVLVIAIATFLFPLISCFILLFMGRISSLSLDNASERTLPYVITVVYYAMAYYLLITKVSLPHQIYTFLLGATLAITASLLINLQWKISAHTIGAGGLIGALLGFSQQLKINTLPELMLVIIIAGLVGYSRLKHNTHTQAQVYVGYLIGFLCEYLVFSFSF